MDRLCFKYIRSYLIIIIYHQRVPPRSTTGVAPPTPRRPRRDRPTDGKHHIVRAVVGRSRPGAGPRGRGRGREAGAGAGAERPGPRGRRHLRTLAVDRTRQIPMSRIFRTRRFGRRGSFPGRPGRCDSGIGLRPLPQHRRRHRTAADIAFRSSEERAVVTPASITPAPCCKPLSESKLQRKPHLETVCAD
jgi:hypothetical protein